MLALYHLLTVIVAFSLRVVALFNKKIRLFVNGRKEVFDILSKNINPGDRVIWVHAASLGEFEQGLPIMQRLKEERPEHKLLLTFFSPSGYEVKKSSAVADIITYLPLDTQKHAAKFVRLVAPELAIFIKYEFWPNYLDALSRACVPVVLVSGVFREDQIFFKFYGAFMRKRLLAFKHFFVQDAYSEKLLRSIGINRITRSGDTRFDRVSEILSHHHKLTFVESFLQGNPCVVIGSSWPEDEALFVPFINNYKGDAKFIIAPHRIKSSAIHVLQKALLKKTVLFSEKDTTTLAGYDVLIVDAVGWLSNIYRYATLAYVGGGMGKKGLHNILEPAVFGIPVVIGKYFSKFHEAVTMVDLGGVLSVQDSEELTRVFYQLLCDEAYQKRTGTINSNYVEEQRGATASVMAGLQKF